MWLYNSETGTEMPQHTPEKELETEVEREQNTTSLITSFITSTPPQQRHTTLLPLQMYRQHGRKLGERNPLFRILLSVVRSGIVLVFSVQAL